MLEHADRHDPLERPFDVAIVLEAEHRFFGSPAFDGALLGARKLLLRKRNAGDLDRKSVV